MKKEHEKEKNEQLAAAFQAHLQKLALPYRTKRTETDGEFAKIHLDFDGFACTLTGTAGYALGLSFLEYETSASTMTVRLRFRDDGMYYDLYDMENLADDTQFETLCFHNVRTPQAADTAAKKLIDGLNRLPGVYSPIPMGAFYTVARLPIDDSDRFCEWCLRDFEYEGETVMLAPASGFYTDPACGRHGARIAYVLCREELQRAVAVLGKALERYRREVMGEA